MVSSGSASLLLNEPQKQQALVWNSWDSVFATLFGPADGLSTHVGTSTEENIKFLCQLDRVVVLFDAYIHHSDEEFRRWRTRHQAAMENGFQQVTTSPKLGVFNSRSTKWKWHDNIWNERYTFRVRQRNSKTLERLREVFDLPESCLNRFFGPEHEAPRREIWLAAQTRQGRHKSKTSYRKTTIHMRNEWTKPIDVLLESVTKVTGIDLETVRLRFWGLQEQNVAISSIKEEQKNHAKPKGMGKKRKREEETELAAEMPDEKRQKWEMDIKTEVDDERGLHEGVHLADGEDIHYHTRLEGAFPKFETKNELRNVALIEKRLSILQVRDKSDKAQGWQVLYDGKRSI
ncbi:Fc.00g064390.m01.CDS01 [Cosmosporella sp. VM-42]